MTNQYLLVIISFGCLSTYITTPGNLSEKMYTVPVVYIKNTMLRLVDYKESGIFVDFERNKQDNQITVLSNDNQNQDKH